jgi:hypothetical protein
MIQNFLDDIYLIQNMSSKEFKKINQNYKLLTPKEIFECDVYQQLKKHHIRHLFCSIGIINVNDIKENGQDKIVGIYNKNFKTNVLFKKENYYQKKFKSLDDLILNPNFCLYVNQVDETVEITLYDNKTLETLFFGRINNQDDEDDFIRPYNCSFVENVASIRDIDAKMTLYPILGYYSNDNIICCDRDILSHKAKSVWYQYFEDNNIFKRYAPIDCNIICEENYKSILYHFINKQQKINFINQNNYFNVKNENKVNRIFKKIIDTKSDTFRKRLLMTLKKHHFLDWTFKLNNNFKEHIKDKITILKNRHKNDKILEKKLTESSNTFFHSTIFT